MIRLIMITIGLVLLIFGIIGVLTPIPFGLFFIILSFLFLIPTSPLALNSIRGLRRRSARFDGLVDQLSWRLPVPYRRILRRTEPGPDQGPWTR